MLDYIDGYKFSEIADFAIDFDRTELSLKMFNANAIIFCKTDFISQLFEHLRFSGRKYILITHMSDYPIDENRFKKAPKSIIKWFAQNAIYNHSDLIPIPIGIENHTGRSKGIATDHKWLEDNIERLRSNPKDSQTLYCNWYSPNNPRDRIGVLQKLRNNHIEYIWGRNCTEDEMENMKESGNKASKISWYDYCDQVSRHKFMVCPPGNGVSIHQPWEALYMGCIPIVKKHRIYENCDGLPIIQVNDWSEITYDLLDSFLNKTYNFEKLYMSYWKTRVLSEFNQISDEKNN